MSEPFDAGPAGAASEIVSASGATLGYANGRRRIDFWMDAGQILAGYNAPEIVDAVERSLVGSDSALPDFGYTAACYADADVALAAAREICGVDATEPFDSTLETASLRSSRLLDMRRGWARIPLDAPELDWEYAVLGRSAAAGFAFGAVLARSAQAALAEHTAETAPAHPTSLAAAAALCDLLGALGAHQTTGRAERLAYGLEEVATATGIDVRPVQPGGLFRLCFGDEDLERRFGAEMFARGFRVPVGGPWYPSLAHDYFDIEATVDAAAAAFVAALD